jgi:hypothetical protein
MSRKKFTEKNLPGDIDSALTEKNSPVAPETGSQPVVSVTGGC